MPDREQERERLNERIQLIRGTDTGRELRRYRLIINKREAILERGAHARTSSNRGRTTYIADDEIELCHKFLDQRNVDECRT